MKLTEILNDLKANPIFRMSLGSKELFHSNFLEFLWDIDDKEKNRFSNMIAKLLKGRKLDFKPESVFDREKENFDVCIHHYENKNKKNGEQGQKTKVYDLIIENKVKSIPRKDQLEEYEEKAKGKGNPVFLLLSLVTDFPCRKELIDDKSPWIVAHYDQLKEAIENHYKDVGERNLKYITDYCQFIGQMHKLQEHMIQDIDNQVYYDEEELNEYKKLRIHDLYIKLRGSMFITRLKEKLEKEPIGATIHILPFNITDKSKKKTRSFKYEDIRPFCKEKGGVHVFLDCTIQRGSGMIAAYIYKHRTNCDYIYEVVIQGDEYRHGINSSNESDLKLLPSNYSDKDKEEANKLLKLWAAVNNRNAGFFQEIHNSTQTCPEYFRKYAPYCVYKYVKLKKNETVSDLIDAFAKDIINIIPKLN